MNITRDECNEYKTIVDGASEKSLKEICHKLLDVILEDSILVEKLRAQLRDMGDKV